MKSILVTGSRHWTDRASIEADLAQLRDQHCTARLLHGGEQGADTIAAELWTQWGLPSRCFPAQWDLYGSVAGPIRNHDMVNAGPVLCLAYPLGASPGTRGCVAMARKAGIEIRWGTGTVEADQLHTSSIQGLVG